VNITSDAGVYRWPQVSAYSVSKAAVIKFTENLAAEAHRSGIRAFSVHPGLTPIGLSERALASDAPPGSAEARVHAWVWQELQAGRGAEPALVARLVTRLAAGDADRLSGCHLSVHDDLDAILACGEGVRDRYQLRRAGTPKRWAAPRVIVPPHLLFLVRGRTPNKSPFQSGRSDQPSAGSQDRSQR
jgi:short chain dehydrogenase